ncbi:hypothetical protein B0H13DRAFT_2282261 [Mycena leptocephala]|nr:hypothetical protein B0H13DRAFT_2282261 [Mycena leptocephala]
MHAGSIGGVHILNLRNLASHGKLCIEEAGHDAHDHRVGPLDEHERDDEPALQPTASVWCAGREERAAGAAIAKLGKPVISLHLEVGEYARQSRSNAVSGGASVRLHAGPAGACRQVCGWSLRGVLRAGRRAGLGVEKRYQRNVFLHKKRLMGTNFAHAILSRVLWADASRSGARQAQGALRGATGGAAGAARAALRRQKSWGVWGREHAWSMWASTCILPHSAVVVVGAALTVLALRACGVAPLEGVAVLVSATSRSTLSAIS